jgi:hypothetical protein
MLSGFGALVAADVAPAISGKAADGQTTYWTAGAFWSTNPDVAAKFRNYADAARLIVLRASGVIQKDARITPLGSWDEAVAGVFRF